MTKRFSTLDDVAKAVGMSRAQVSRALRGDPGVHPDTRKLIDKAAAELAYQPNLAARSLVSAKSSIVGVVLGDPDNPFHIQLARAVDRRLLAEGFDPVASLREIVDESVDAEADRWLRLRAAGLILIATPRDPSAVGKIAQKLPCIYIGSKKIDHPRVSEIVVDDESGIRKAIKHLILLGHSDIALLAGDTESSAHERAQAYIKVMSEEHLEPIIIRGEHNSVFGRNGIDALFNSAYRPTAIIASNDLIAVGALDRLKGMGVNVPGDVSVVGFDDIPDASNQLFSLTTLKQDVDEQALSAVTCLKKMLRNEGAVGERLSMPVSLVIRSSTAAPRS